MLRLPPQPFIIVLTFMVRRYRGRCRSSILVLFLLSRTLIQFKGHPLPLRHMGLGSLILPLAKEGPFKLSGKFYSLSPVLAWVHDLSCPIRMKQYPNSTRYTWPLLLFPRPPLPSLSPRCKDLPRGGPISAVHGVRPGCPQQGSEPVCVPLPLQF